MTEAVSRLIGLGSRSHAIFTALAEDVSQLSGVSLGDRALIKRY